MFFLTRIPHSKERKTTTRETGLTIKHIFTRDDTGIQKTSSPALYDAALGPNAQTLSIKSRNYREQNQTPINVI